MEHSIVPFSEKNIADFPVLYKAVYGKNIALADVLKKFDTKYLIDGYFGYFAYDGTKPIAFYGAIPMLMQHKNDTELAAQSVNTMTHPEYSGKGLFTKLALMTYDLLAKSGIRFIWGFPNQHSEPGFLNKLEWEFQHRLEGHSVKIPVHCLRKIAEKVPFLKNFYHNKKRAFFLSYKTENWAQSSHGNFVSVCRNKAFYDYKSFSGNFVIVIDGCYFWINLNSNCWIGDAFAPSENQFHESFQKLRLLCKKAGISEIMLQTSPKMPLARLMKNEETKHFESWIAGYKNFNSDFPLETMQFTLGDTDIF